MRRHRKKPRVQAPPIPDPPPVEDDNYEEDDDEPAVRRKQKRNHVERQWEEDSLPVASVEAYCNKVQQEDARIEDLVVHDKWAFCCATCACSAEKRSRAEHLRYVVSGDNRFPHRPCCHGVLDVSPPPEWASSFETACAHVSSAILEKMLSQQAEEVEDSNKPVAAAVGQQEEDDGTSKSTHCYYEPAEASQIRKHYETAKRLESRFANVSDSEDPTAALYTNDDYQALSRAFLERVKNQQRRSGAVVLDLFSGMGTALVALKRLSVAMKKVIHCERDKVATHAYQEHHNNGKDGVEYVHYPWFEDIAESGSEEAYHSFMDAHAPIDILIAGPPCQDFTGINASRQGLDGRKGSYMMETARLVRRIQSDTRQAGKPMYYLLENVVLRNDKELPLAQGDKERIQRALGCSWDAVELDAACLSPCTRVRSFFTNIRLRSWSHGQTDDDDDLLMCNPTSVLQDGFRLAANLDVYEPEMLAKVPTFMASKARINDLRMLVYRQGEPSYVSRIITRSERLQLMGFPSNYLDCLDQLYETLLHDGHEKVAFKHWKEALDARYHAFQGAFHGVSNPYEFVDVPAPADSGVPRCVEMRLLPFNAAPTEFLNAEDYGKRLVGNAMSVPVLEFCLSELTGVFAKCRYEGYDYTYAWQKQQQQQQQQPTTSSLFTMDEASDGIKV